MTDPRDPAREASPRAGSIAPGSNGPTLARRIYRRSPLRWLHNVWWDHRGLEPTDVFLASYPRSGSTWMRFLVMEMTAGGARFEGLRENVPEIGRQRRARSVLPGGGRVIKTHEPYMRRYRRAIHLVRDPRDVAISYFRFMQRLEKIVIRPTDDGAASFDRFLDALIAGRIDAFGTWQSHLSSWLCAADERRADVLRLRYEDIRADPAARVLDIGRWLGLELSAADAQRVAQRCDIELMRAAERRTTAEADTDFARRGRRTGISAVDVGRVEGWREQLTPEQSARFSTFAEGLELMGYPPA